MIKYLFPGIFLFTFFHTVQAQIPDFFLVNPDSNYIEQNKDMWSIRIYSVLKSQLLQYRNQSDSYNYRPNNVTGAGIGVSYQSLLLDLGINLKLEQENPSDRFDLQGDLIWKQHFISFYIQKYRGFDYDEGTSFRKDLKTQNFGFNYLHLFNHKRLSLAAAFQGTQIQKKSAGSLGLGAFFSVFKTKADSSFLPDNNFGDANVEKINSVFPGLMASYTHMFVLPQHLFLLASAGPGIGWQITDIKTDDWFNPAQNLLFKFQGRVSLGYSGPKIYVISTFFDEIFLNSLSDDLKSRLDVVKIKLVIGYRF